MPTPIASYFGSDISTNPIVLGGGFTPTNGELLTVTSSSWDTANGTGASTGGGQTYTPRKTAAPGGFNGYARIDSAVISGSPGAMSVTVAAPAGSTRHSAGLIRWPVGCLPGAVNTTINGSGSPSSGLTTGANGSGVVQCSCDVSSIDPATVAYLNSATQYGLLDGHVGANSVQYHAYVPNIGAAGAYTIGESAPGGQTWVQVVLEVLDAGGTTWTVTPTDSAGLTDATIDNVLKVLTDDVGLADGLVGNVGKILTDSAGLTDALIDTLTKVISDSAGLSDSATSAVLKILTDSAGLSDGLVSGVTKVLTDSVGLSDPAFIAGPPPSALSVEWAIRARGSRWKITRAAPDTPDDGGAVRWRST